MVKIIGEHKKIIMNNTILHIPTKFFLKKGKISINTQNAITHLER